MGELSKEENREINKVVNESRSPEIKTPIANEVYLPNYSGDHSGGTVRTTPTKDTDIPNKKYVDDTSGGGGTWTDTSTNTGTNKTLNSFSNKIDADDIHEQLRNESGDTMNRGDAVFISGYSVGQERALVTLANADSGATMPCVALLEDSSLANNATGHFIEVGGLTNLATDAWSVGDELYISGTATSGNTLTNTKPTGTALIQKVAVVLRSHATLGVLEVFGAGRSNDIPNTSPINMILTGDNNTGDTQYTAQVLHGTDASPPTASNFPKGTIYVQYTA